MEKEIYIFDGIEYDDLDCAKRDIDKMVKKGTLVKINVVKAVPIDLIDYMGGVVDGMFETVNDNIYDATDGELSDAIWCDTAARMHLEQRIADLLYDSLDFESTLARERLRTISYISEGAE